MPRRQRSSFLPVAFCARPHGPPHDSTTFAVAANAIASYAPIEAMGSSCHPPGRLLSHRAQAIGVDNDSSPPEGCTKHLSCIHTRTRTPVNLEGVPESVGIVFNLGPQATPPRTSVSPCPVGMTWCGDHQGGTGMPCMYATSPRCTPAGPFITRSWFHSSNYLDCVGWPNSKSSHISARLYYIYFFLLPPPKPPKPIMAAMSGSSNASSSSSSCCFFLANRFASFFCRFRRSSLSFASVGRRACGDGGGA